MSETYAVPGVYVTESNALALSIQSGETAVPVFVGFFNAVHPPKPDAPLACVRIESWLDFTQHFGASDQVYVIADQSPPKVDDSKCHAHVGSYSVRLYFENGGGPCYVLSVDRDRLVQGTNDVKAQIGAAIELCADITLLCWCEYTDQDASVYDALGTLLGASATSGGNRGMFLLADAWHEATGIKAPTLAEPTQVATYFPALQTDYARMSSDEGVTVRISDEHRKAFATYVTPPVGDVTLAYIRQVFEDVKAGKLRPRNLTANEADVVEGESVVDDVSPGRVLEMLYYGVLHEVLTPYFAQAARVVVRASVAMAGVVARVDRDRGVWKAPANEGLIGVADLVSVEPGGKNPTSIRVDDGLNAKLVDAKINAIRAFRGKGAMVWGARTMADAHQTNWRYVSVRRLFNTVERDARAALRTAVFEPNSAVTWEAVRGALDHYLNALWRQGALQGDTPAQAYFVRVGLGTTMKQEDVSAGRMIVRMGLAAVRPAEFIVLELTQNVASA
ncbi:phage tail sheath family protein (plasmid) [Burkholderia sp. MS455]|uniref:phage tail sheath family protein n=1 Tax=Burkholderia sp. MS455 TaxID=2811788 RepID=UPI001AFC4D40|nr:phage tail sheath C-terminal domain-containing protein [Burkholderia sp. MS455]QRR07657.1 phage tail sheath family protein [Burkholderia sp. MS455]QRR11837.1 phage tail sheath family protein [Burkholderia sp. MS455]